MSFTRFYEINPRFGMQIENWICNYARGVSNGQYDGGQWEVLVDEDDVYVVYPDVDKITIGYAPNYVEPLEITPEAFGVYLCLVMYNSICCQAHEQGDNAMCEKFSSMYHSLRIWLLDSNVINEVEVNHIMKMID